MRIEVDSESETKIEKNCGDIFLQPFLLKF